MDSKYEEQEDYFGKCGELFLTVKGSIAFHCTLCKNRYKGFQEYNEHILEIHYAPIFDEELTVSMTEVDNSFYRPSEEDVELIVNDEEDIGVDPIKNQTHVPQRNKILNCEPGMENQRIEALSDDLDDDFTPCTESNSVGSSDIICSITKNGDIRTDLRNINVKPTITNRKYQCPHCGFLGADRANMKSHIKRHSPNKPHQCAECPKAFHTRTELNTHLRTHTGERPYLCTLCGMSFITSSQLCSHQRRHNNVRNKQCSECEMRFHDLRSLRGHMVVHSDKRNYKCKLCDASFKLSTGLKTHIKLHENKREYQCKVCDSRFNQRAGLYSHMKSCHTVVAKGSVKHKSNE